MATQSILNHPPQTLSGPQLLHELINWTGNGKSCAIDFTSNGKRIQYSYAEVKSCISSLASEIQKVLIPPSQTQHQQPQPIIPLLLPQCPGLYISQLATLESGGAFCPINLDAPLERIKFVVGDVAAKIIITTSEFKDMVVWENGPQVIVVDEFPMTIEKVSSGEHSSFDATATDLAYVMYTSGSSGTPKGVAVSNLAVVQSLLAHQKHIPQFKRFLQFAAPSFDVSVFEIFFPLIRGSTLVGCDRIQLLNDLPGMITSLDIDAAELTPTVAGSLLQKRANAPCLKLLLTIGEMLTTPIVEEFGGSETRESMLYGMYGPTEAAIHCNINPAMESDSKPGNVGIPLDTVSNFVAAAAKSVEDAQNLEFLPVGEIGELILGGPQLARGYLNRDAQNKAAFVHFEGNFYYRTGDKARILRDGTVEIHGRISAGQVKLRGQRVELGEIEEAVFKHDGIMAVVAAVMGSVLVVFALSEDETITPEDIIKTCSKWLPKFMVPSEIVLLKRFSYLPSGKVDKRKLESDYQQQRKENEGSSSTLLTAMEKIVKGVLQDVLGPFPSNARLGAAGLDSLQSIRVSSMLRKLGFNIPTLTVLQSDTLQSLVCLCEDSKASSTQSLDQQVVSQPITKLDNDRESEDIEETLPCTPLQAAMLAETAADKEAYRNWVELAISGITDSKRVVDAFLTLADNNPILRTGFMESHDSHAYVQVVQPKFPVSQIEEVASFDYALDKIKDSLTHPVRMQLLPENSHIKILLHIHHALYDAWSLELLLDDLNTILMSNATPLRPPFANLVSAYQDGSILPSDHSAQDYWKDHLAHLDIRGVPNFHSSKRPLPGLSIAQLETTLSTSSIEAKAKQLSSSSQSLFQAAYSVLLASYLGSTDISFGTVFSGRTLPVPGIEDMAGPCLSTLPIRIDNSLFSNFEELAREINATNRKHMSFSALPLRDIKLAAGVNPRQQIFDTLLIWQQTLHSHDHKREHVSLVDTVDNLEFNLTLEIIPGVNNIEFKANYQRSIFPLSQIQTLLSQMESLVRLFLNDESTLLSDAFKSLPIHVLSFENDRPQTALGLESLSFPIERIAAEDSDRPAIEFATSVGLGKLESHKLTYGELNMRANQIANLLLGEGVLPDELVCVCMEKCVDLYTSILAVSKTGAGYLPITPDTPLERIKHILKEAKIRTVITQSSSCSLFTSLHGMHVIQLDTVSIKEFSSKDIQTRFAPDNISYCVYTSGSTGTPKGVLVTQGNLVSNLDALSELYPTSKDTRLLQSCSQAFDVSVFEIFFTWRIGGCICSATKDVLFRDIEEAIRLLEVSHLSLTPTVAALVNPDNVPKVQFLVTAGEAVTQKVFNSWSGRGLYQGYGPSETTNICTVNSNVSRCDSINNIGRPFKNTSAFVLQAGSDFSLVPRGGEGEFCFGGSQVFRGYLNKDQELGKIIDHPEFGRLYRSGDFGRLMPDGTLAFTGRKDDQVKIRGQRVELGEINNVMLQSTEVADCITMVIGTNGDDRGSLVCFWTPKIEHVDHFEILPPETKIIAKLFHTLEAALPAYMIPTTLIPVSKLPSTPQGKIDKRLLTKEYQVLNIEYLNSASRSLESASDHSWTELESQVANGLSEITSVALPDIGPETSFFSLGIDSISAISLASKLRKATGRQIEISDILKHSSVARLAERLKSTSQSTVQDSESSQSPKNDFESFFEQSFLDSVSEHFNKAGKEVSEILPCTPLQEAMLSAAESSNDKLYRSKVVFQVFGDNNTLINCWTEMVHRHEILRTCFISTDSPQRPYAQIVLKRHELRFAEPDNSNSVETEPPYSIQLCEIDGTTKLILSMHHALYDAVALEVLYSEVEAFYRGEALTTTVPFGTFLKQTIGGNMEQSDRFWEETMRGFLPAKFRSVAPQNSEARKDDSYSRVQRRVLSRPYTWVEASLKKHSTSMLAACHSAWSSILSAQLQENDICFGNVVSGRTIPMDGIDRLVAPCFNTIPVRLSNIANTSYLEAFRNFQALNADSLPFQFTPLRRIQSKFSSNGSRLFDTLFILQHPSKALDPAIWKIKEDDGVMDFPLVCEIAPRPDNDTVEVILHSYSSMFTEDESSDILTSFEENLKAALENPRRQMLSSNNKEMIAKKQQNREQVEAMPSSTPHRREMDSLELALRDIIGDFTDVALDNIGPDISIFRLGLDSISTVQVATRLRKQGYKILASDILENPTIAKLASHLSLRSEPSSEIPEFDFDRFDQRYRASICAKNKLNPENITAIRPCTAVQNGMIAQTLHSDGKEYVNSMWLELDSTASLPDFKGAWKSVCAKHEMLRTGFAQIEDPLHPFVMITYLPDNLALPWIKDGSNLSAVIESATDLLRPLWSLRISENNNSSNIIQFQIHHALYDAHSMQIILSDLSMACAGKEIGTIQSISPMLGAILQTSEADQPSKQNFWQREENKIIVNRFPDLTPLRISDVSSGVCEILSSASTTKLEESCREMGVTMQAATQTTWGKILASYTGATSTTFGITLSGRSVHETAELTSFPSIVTLPVRCDVFGTNSEILQRTMTSNALLHKHQFTPLTSIQKWTGYPEGRMFDTLFAYQKLPDSDSEVHAPWKVVQEEASIDYAVSLEVQPTKSGKLILRLTFKNNLIPVEHADLILRQFDALLLDTLLQPDNSCDVAPKAGFELLSITPANQKVLPGPVTLLHEFVERGARMWPDRVAFEFATNLGAGSFTSHKWTYAQLDQESNKVAHLLVDRGVVPGQIVGICFDKCAEASFAIIGILKAGSAYVALDPTAPADRLKFIAQDSGAKLILTAGKPGDNIKGVIDSDIICLDEPTLYAHYPTTSPELARDVVPHDVSYCLYTSGTTGTPKGCLITHDSAVQAMYSFQILFDNHWTTESKWLQFASFHFDVSVLEQFWSWSVGICVASAPRDLIFEDIPGAIQQLGITHIDLTPSLARLVHPDEVPSLCKGVFITGGEPLKQEILDVWGQHACVYNGYGPTEATIGVTMYPRVPKNGNPSNIGPQFENVGSFVLKPGTSLPVLRGGVGELCVSGKLVGKGYLNRPELTAERFPTLESFNERVYRTGDLVRILHDGSFIFLGRADDQVKLRGQRLELTEINEVIKQGVAELDQVVTLVLKHVTQQKEQLVTFFVMASIHKDHNDEGSLISRMRDACKSRLPGYMVPTHFIPIEKLPLNANNKADSKQLAALYNNLSVDDLQQLSQSSQIGKDWSEIEQPLVTTISRILSVEETAITRNSNIFELGVDSISIIGFSRSLQSSGFEHAKLSLVKSNPSIDGLVAALLRGSVSNQGTDDIYVASAQKIAAFAQRHIISICGHLGIEHSEIEAIAPCTPVQEGMIYRFLESDSPLYFNKFEFNLEEGIDPTSLLSAWGRVIQQLQILRTKFVETDDGYAQVALRPVPGQFKPFYPSYTEVSKSASLKMPFGLVITPTSSGQTMHLQIFHGLYDGNSLTILLRCVVAEYRQLEGINYGSPYQTSLPFGPLALVSGSQLFWTQHLENWSYQPISHLQNSDKDAIATREVRNLANFEGLRKQLGVSHQSIIQAAWISVLQSIATASITLGMVTSGRAIDFEGAGGVIGPLFNTVPFHTTLEAATLASELISRCHKFNMEMQTFQHTPLKDIQKWSPATPGESLFDALFVFQRPDEDEESFADGVWRQVDGGHEADYPIAFEATLSPDSSKLDLVIVAQGACVSQTKAEELLAQFETTILEILRSDAKNIIEGGRNADATTVKPAESEILQPAPSPSPSFIWTQRAKQIRTEIATLAKVATESIHENSSIFELGLDSIDVIKLSSRLRRIGVEIPVSIIIKCQSISSMIGKISENGRIPAKSSSGELLQKMSQDLKAYLEKSQKFGDVEEILPATPLQQSMVNEMIRSGYKRYFNIEAFKLGDGVDLERLKKAAKAVISQSPILRTTFTEIQDPKFSVSFAQVVHQRESEYAQSIAKTRKLATNPSIQGYLDVFASKAIKSAKTHGKLFQIRFFVDGNAKYMVMAISHALYDGSSLRALHDDFSSAYRATLSLRPDHKPLLEQVFQSTTNEAKSFWRTTVSNMPPSKFPRNEEGQKEEQVQRLEKRSGISLEKVEALCKSSRITLQTVGQTCWALVLAQLMGQLDVVFGSVLSCRDTEESGNVMFPLMNTVAVRSVIHGTLEELLRYMQDMSDTTRQYQHFPLGTAQAYALASRSDQNSTRDTTLFDTLFIYQGRRAVSVQEPLYESVFGLSDVEFPLCVEMEIVDDKYLTWTTACKSTAAVEATHVIESLDSVLERLISSAQSQTIQSNFEGISICGLPRFKKANETPKSQRNLVTPEIDSEWSITESNIRRALHELSDVPEDNIKKNSTIFHLGLDSILILKLPALLRSNGINLRVSEILREQTVSAMAVAAVRSTTTPVEIVDIDSVLKKATMHVNMEPYRYQLERSAGPIEEILPVTAGQLFVIRQWQSSRGVLFYSTFTYSIPVRINKARLDRAWRILLQRHEVLRTGFIEVGSELVQVVFQAPHNDVIYQSQGSAPMRRHDLAYPPINLILEEGKDVDAQLKLVIHHALYDGVSLPKIIAELQVLYKLEELELPTFKFRDFVAQSLFAASKESIKQRWTSYLQTDDTTHAERANAGNERTEIFRPATPISNLRRTAQSEGVSIDALLLATIAKVRAQRMKDSSLPHVIIGIYHSNRAPFAADLSTLCAPTLNLLPLIIHNPLAKTIAQIARGIQEDLQIIGSGEMSGVGLDQIYEWTGVKVDFFVNILKDGGGSEREAEGEWKGLNLEVQKRAEVRREVLNENIAAAVGDGGAFVPSVDVEMRYTGDEEIDIGVFAPTSILVVKEGEGMIEDFLGFWM